MLPLGRLGDLRLTRYTNISNLPQPIFDAVAGDPYSRGISADISVTSLIDSPRLEALKEAHKDEIVEDVADMANSLIGNAVHKMLAEHSSGRFDDAERLFMDVTTMFGTWRVSGQTDYASEDPLCYVCHDGAAHIDHFKTPDETHMHHPEEVCRCHWFEKAYIITDWKTPSVNEAKFGLKPERTQQANCYAALFEANGFHVTGLQACLITKNWSPYDVNLAEHSIVTRQIELWPLEKTHAYIEERVAAHQQARVTLPECSPDERWQEADTFAVVKVGSVRAVRGGVKNTEEEAEALAQELSETTPHIVEYRAGDPTTADRRCFSWKCVAFPFCDQGQALHTGVGG